jgi:hypothetical protein
MFPNWHSQRKGSLKKDEGLSRLLLEFIPTTVEEEKKEKSFSCLSRVSCHSSSQKGEGMGEHSAEKEGENDFWSRIGHTTYEYTLLVVEHTTP